MGVWAGSHHIVAVTETRQALAAGNNADGQCDVSHWRDIVAVAAGSRHTVGLCADGSVLATGCNDDGQCEVGNWVDLRVP